MPRRKGLEAAVIRNAELADVATVEALQHRWQEEGITHGLVADSRDEIAAGLGRYFVVAEHAGETVGYGYGQVRESPGLAVVPRGRRYLEIEDLYVTPEARGQGLGRRLVEHLRAVARDEGVAYLMAYSAARDVDSVLRFYRRNGFEPWFVQVFQGPETVP